MDHYDEEEEQQQSSVAASSQRSRKSATDKVLYVEEKKLSIAQAEIDEDANDHLSTLPSYSGYLNKLRMRPFEIKIGNRAKISIEPHVRCLAMIICHLVARNYMVRNPLLRVCLPSFPSYFLLNLNESG